jgi:putative N-acetyltransferase (TIGR04045 family)
VLIEPFRPFVASEFRVKLATEAWEVHGAAALRRQVFCTEQGIFERDDRDALDERAIPIVALAHVFGWPDQVVGTVRIDEREPGLWWGSRLAVDADHRRLGALGTSLIRLAVTTAHDRGCRRFLAHVQAANAPLFHRLHWHTLEEVALFGRPHHFMEADLDFYPPCHDGDTGFLTMSRQAA